MGRLENDRSRGDPEDWVPGIEEDIIPKSEPEYNMPVHEIPDEGETVSPIFFLKSHQSLRTSRKTQTQTRQHTIDY